MRKRLIWIFVVAVLGVEVSVLHMNERAEVIYNGFPGMFDEGLAGLITCLCTEEITHQKITVHLPCKVSCGNVGDLLPTAFLSLYNFKKIIQSMFDSF